MGTATVIGEGGHRDRDREQVSASEDSHAEGRGPAEHQVWVRDRLEAGKQPPIPRQPLASSDPLWTARDLGLPDRIAALLAAKTAQNQT